MMTGIGRFLRLAVLPMFLIFFAGTQSEALAQTVAPELPAFPASPLSVEDSYKLAEKNSQQDWAAYAKQCKDKAVDLALKQLYPESASWLYTGLMADVFASEGGALLSKELKAAMMKNLPAFFDFYESIRPEDSLEKACEVLETIYKVYPAATVKYLRCAYAVSLIYDSLPPGAWPQCNVPSNPAPISQAQEVFNLFMEDPSTFVLPFDRMTVGELIFVFGVAGPIDELKELKNPRMTPYALEKLTQSIKTDQTRIKGAQTLAWDESEHAYTPENIRKYGGLPVDKVYYAWRVANANAIPCLYFSEVNGGKVYNWLWYMSRPGIWKADIARDSAAKSLYGRPLNPQTWKPVELSDVIIVSKRHFTAQYGVDSLLFFRISEMLFERKDFSNAAFFAEKSMKSNPENWKCYGAFISAKARLDATSDELDALWRKSYEAFRKYPDICIMMLNNYRANLAMRRNQKEADRLFIAEMRTAMRVDTGFAVEMYSRQLSSLFASVEDKSEMFGFYQDVLRNCTNCQSECYRKIVAPLATLFGEGGDYKSAQKVLSMFNSTLRQDESALRLAIQKLSEKYTPPRTKKEKKEFEEAHY